ncbi:extracellular solute-binding protein [Agromyces silvae]|uniref:extracellular solute-binding protein n=1 Tax=Agromyces silvae TaxID=3388266 RepID=UPI00280BF80D|nr:extracellular solute-binding protein [Agromyces protaetiae]
MLAIPATIALLAGCAGTEPATPPEERDLGTPVAGEIAEGVLSGVTLTYAGSGGILQDGQAEAIWDPFATQSGATFLQDAFDTGKLKAMVESGSSQWDLVITGNLDTAEGCGELYEEIDYSLLDVSNVPEGTITDDCMVPNILYGLVVAYNTDAFGENPPTSAADFFDTEKFPGKRTVGQSTYPSQEMIEFGFLAQGKDPADITPEDIPTGLDLYKDLGDDLITWTTGAQAQQQLESGEAVMGLVWSGRGYGAAAAGAPVAPMWEDWIVLVDSLAIPKGVKDPQAAHAAINVFLGAEQQARATELTSYSPVNVNADPEVDDLLQEWLTTDRLDTGHASDLDFWIEHYDALNAAWADWTTGN